MSLSAREFRIWIQVIVYMSEWKIQPFVIQAKLCIYNQYIESSPTKNYIHMEKAKG